MRFSLREPPAQRVDLKPLVPQTLAGKTVAEIERIEVGTTRVRLTVPYSLRGYDGWVVTAQPPNDERVGPVVLTT